MVGLFSGLVSGIYSTTRPVASRPVASRPESVIISCLAFIRLINDPEARKDFPVEEIPGLRSLLLETPLFTNVRESKAGNNQHHSRSRNVSVPLK